MNDGRIRKYWWFGINNADEDKEQKKHMLYPEVAPVISGEKDEFIWRHPRKNRKIYSELNTGDRVLLWMGDGEGGHKDWGIIGFFSIKSIDLGNQYILEKEYIPTKALTPYKSRFYRIEKTPNPTEDTEFLKETFGLEFSPLKTTFKNVGYGVESGNPTTIIEISKTQYRDIFEKIKEIN